MLHVPIERGGHADEPKRFGGRGGVRHNDVVALLLAVLIDVHHGAELFHAGENGEFFGFDAANASGSQHRTHVRGDLLPMTLDLFLNIQLENGEAIGDLQRIGGLRVEEVVVQVKAVGQAVRWIDAHDQGAVAKFGEFHSGRSSEAGFADAALAGEHENPHENIIELRASPHRD